MKIKLFDSLKVQLCAGAIALLAVTIFSLSYILIQQEKRILTNAIEKSVILLGRNIAHSSEQALLRSDPEYELYPLVTRICEKNTNVSSVLITDPTGTIMGGIELQQISKTFVPELSGYTIRKLDILAPNERLLDSDDFYLFRTQIRSLENITGYVHMTYSKHELLSTLKQAIIITIICGCTAFFLAIGLSLFIFRRISHPMDLLVQGVNAFGQGNFDTRIQPTGNNEFRVLSDSFNRMASSIVEAQKKLVEKEITDRELEIAHDIQSVLIPSSVKDPLGYQIGLYYQSARQVGGDYMDIFPVDSHKLVCVMADVSGKGIPGLVVTGMLKILVHELVKIETDPNWILRQINTAIAKHMRKNMFVTMFIAFLDTEREDIVFSSAGHNPTLLYHRETNSCEFIRLHGSLMGFFSDKYFSRKLSDMRIRLDPGDFILQYTDGLTESTDSNGEMFGFERIFDSCKRNGSAGPRAIIDLLVKDEAAFRGEAQPCNDDLSLLAVGPTAPVEQEITMPLTR